MKNLSANTKLLAIAIFAFSIALLGCPQDTSLPELPKVAYGPLNTLMASFGSADPTDSDMDIGFSSGAGTNIYENVSLDGGVYVSGTFKAKISTTQTELTTKSTYNLTFSGHDISKVKGTQTATINLEEILESGVSGSLNVVYKGTEYTVDYEDLIEELELD